MISCLKKAKSIFCRACPCPCPQSLSPPNPPPKGPAGWALLAPTAAHACCTRGKGPHLPLVGWGAGGGWGGVGVVGEVGGGGGVGCTVGLNMDQACKGGMGRGAAGALLPQAASLDA